ncbi:MAG: acetyl-CoA carboxylase biotin carboxyl carrier protein subunit [Bacteroidetes bacterium]|nr:acetyl-CoA carboxylase biotin carboxyl carrier protein subunit [Bacteroidota bacterium]
MAEEKKIPEPAYEIFELDDSKFQTTFNTKFRNRKPYKPDDPRLITGFIPGTIIRIFVKEKDKVKAGDTLLVLQAMKMNNRILSPINGVIKKIHVEEGSNIAKRQLLIELK